MQFLQKNKIDISGIIKNIDLNDFQPKILIKYKILLTQLKSED
jgi:hypothetical protein